MPDDNQASLAQLLTQLIKEKDGTRDLISAFGRGEISSDYVVKELVSRYQREVLGAMHGLAVFDEVAAKRLGDSLRQGIEGVVAQIGAPAAGANVRIPADTPPRTQGIGALSDRDDPVLRREFMLVSLLSQRPNEIFRTGELIAAARELEAAISDEAVTAHLARLAASQIIERAKKGYYRSTPKSSPHLLDLKSEIEARGLPLPARG